MQQDHSTFTEAELTDAFRRQAMDQLERQTRAVESIRNMISIYFIIAIIVGVVLAVGVLAAGNGGV